MHLTPYWPLAPQPDRMPNTNISNTIRRIVTLLVDEDYLDLEKLSHGRRLTAGEMDQAIQDYGEKLVLPPDEAFEDLDVIKVEASQPPEWSVVVYLWTEREGKSDLSLELTLTEIGNGEFKVEIDNLHVL